MVSWIWFIEIYLSIFSIGNCCYYTLIYSDWCSQILCYSHNVVFTEFLSVFDSFLEILNQTFYSINSSRCLSFCFQNSRILILNNSDSHRSNSQTIFSSSTLISHFLLIIVFFIEIIFNVFDPFVKV